MNLSQVLTKSLFMFQFLHWFKLPVGFETGSATVDCPSAFVLPASSARSYLVCRAGACWRNSDLMSSSASWSACVAMTSNSELFLDAPTSIMIHIITTLFHITVWTMKNEEQRKVNMINLLMPFFIRIRY